MTEARLVGHVAVIDSPETLQKWRDAGRIGHLALQHGATLCEPGTPLTVVAGAVEAYIRDAGMEPAFPCTLSLNECAAHFTPTHDDDAVLQEGDLVKLDCGASNDGALSDNALTVEVGRGDTGEHADLIATARACLQEALSVIGPNANLGDVGAVIEHTAKDRGFKTIQNLTGHSLETYNLHAGLTVPNVDMKVHRRPRIGDVLAVEPFVTNGSIGRVENSGPGNIYHFQRNVPLRMPSQKRLLGHIGRVHPQLPFAERWLTGVIEDKKLGFNLLQLQKGLSLKHYPALSEGSGGMVAQFEATIVVTEDGCEVLTKA